MYFKPTSLLTDIQAPKITCPPDMENIPTEPGQSYAIVTWQIPVPTDNSNDSLTLDGLRPPQKLNVGRENITYKVIDSSGLSSSCMFFIHVKGAYCFTYIIFFVTLITSSSSSSPSSASFISFKEALLRTVIYINLSNDCWAF